MHPKTAAISEIKTCFLLLYFVATSLILFFFFYHLNKLNLTKEKIS